jgi:hypothetical protein
VKTNYVLIDFENVQVKSLALLKGDNFYVRVFLGPANLKLPVDLVLAMQGMGTRAMYITLETPGKNALDFHIAYYLGIMTKDDPAGFFHVISKDGGFDPLIHHLKGKKILAARSAAIEEMPCFTDPLSPLSRQTVPIFQGAIVQPEPPRLMTKSTRPVDVATVIASTLTPPKEIKTAPVTSSLDDLVKAALGDLIKRKASRPRTVRTLLSTIHATCGKELSDSKVHLLYEVLVKRGYVKLEGTRVTYNLPSSYDLKLALSQ